MRRSLEPNSPPMNGQMTCTCSPSSPKTPEMTRRTPCTTWVESHSVSVLAPAASHRAVVVCGSSGLLWTIAVVYALDGDLGGRHRRGDVAVRGVRRVSRVDLVGRVEVALVGGQFDVEVRLLVLHPDELRGVPGGLGGLGDDHPDQLPPEGDLGVLQDRQLGVLRGRQPLGAEMGQHGEDAVDGLGCGRVDRGDPAPRDRRLDRGAEGGVLDVGLEGVGRGAPHLRLAVPAGEVLPDGPRLQQLSHARPPVRSGRAGRRPACGPAGFEAVAAVEPRLGDGVGELGIGGRAVALPGCRGPRSASSARVARHGLWATPPNAIRTSVTVPSVTSSAAATETSANA